MLWCCRTAAEHGRNTATKAGWRRSRSSHRRQGRRQLGRHDEDGSVVRPLTLFHGPNRETRNTVFRGVGSGVKHETRCFAPSGAEVKHETQFFAPSGAEAKHETSFFDVRQRRRNTKHETPFLLIQRDTKAAKKPRHSRTHELTKKTIHVPSTYAFPCTLQRLSKLC